MNHLFQHGTMARPRRERRGFVLPLVIVLSLVAAVAVTILFSRRSMGRIAMEKQSDNYVGHHLQNGIRDMIAVVLTTCRRAEGSKLATGTIGFDLAMDGGLTAHVRLKDAGGAVLLTRDPGDSVRLLVMRNATVNLIKKNQTSEAFLRGYGPAKVSIHAAAPEVLEALAAGVDPACDAKAFADAVVEARERADIKSNEVRTLAGAANIAPDRMELLEAVVATEPQIWWCEARVTDTNGKVVIAQGGLVQGAMKQSLAASSGSWSVISWGPLPEGGLPGFANKQGSTGR